MGTGYTRNDGSNNIADGNVINASDLDGEFDAVVSAFSTSGHTHDGTAAEGGPVTVLGPVQDFVATATEIKPKTTNTLSIGTASLQFKDLYIDGTAYIDGIGEDTLVATDKKVQFRDSAIFINSSADGQLDIDADTTLQITAPTVDIDASTAVTISNDLKLNNDDAVLGLGADNDVTLTHIPDTGVRLNTTSAVQFRDSALSINSSTDGQLDIDADTEIEITAPTVDLTASTAVTVSNDLKLASDAAVLGFGADNDVTLTHVHNTGVLLNDAMAIQIRDSGLSINSSTDGQLDIDADTEIEITTGTLDINATTTDISGALDVNGALTASDTVDIQATHPTGTSNVGFGSGTFANIEAGGTLNTAMGVNALQDLTTGDSNTAIGYQAALNSTTAVGTTAIGRLAIGVGVLTGNYNTALGYAAGQDLTSGEYNTAIGYAAAANATTAFDTIAIGRSAISAGVLTGTANTAIGTSAGGDLTSGEYNNFIGYGAGQNATTGDSNVAIGRQAIGLGVLTGTNNVALGYQAGYDLTSGDHNILFGFQAGSDLTTGTGNIFQGNEAGEFATTANYGIAIGHTAIGAGVMTGDNNIAIGRIAGHDLTSSTHKSFIGYTKVVTQQRRIILLLLVERLLV